MTCNPRRKNTDFKEQEQPKKNYTRIDSETLNELRKKGLCFTCKEPYTKDHKCSTKAMVLLIEYQYEEDGESEK
jgi:hypothetical protein